MKERDIYAIAVAFFGVIGITLLLDFDWRFTVGMAALGIAKGVAKCYEKLPKEDKDTPTERTK